MKNRGGTINFRFAVILGVLGLLIFGTASTSLAVQPIGSPQCSPSSLYVNQSSVITVTATIPLDPKLISTSVNLVRLNEKGQSIAILATMHDDGTHGDLLAGDGTFTTEITLDSSTSCQINLAVTAAYKGTLLRSKSPVVAFNVVEQPIFKLSIDNFGRGNISDNVSGIDCGGGGTVCSAQIIQGQTVTLNAQPSEGWFLHHWDGCDSSEGDSCKVNMSSDKTVSPVFGMTTMTLKPNVIVLDSTTMSLLRNQAGTTLIFDISATAIAKLQVGDVIISQLGDGFARRVKSVTVLQGSSIYVETENATLEDIIKEGTLIFNQTLTAPVGETSVSSMMTAAGSVSSGDTFDTPVSISGDFDILGNITGTITPDFDVSFNNGINEIRFAINGSSSASLAFSSSSSVSLEVKKYHIKTISFPKITIWTETIPPVPIIIFPNLDIDIPISIEDGAELTASMNRSDWAQYGIHYIKSYGFKPISSHTYTQTVQPPTFAESVALTGGVDITLGLYLYDTIGPQAILEPYLELEGKKVNVQPPCSDVNLFLGLSGSAALGGQIPVVDWTLPSISLQLFNKRDSILKGGTCPDMEPPSTPKNLAALAVSSTEIDLTWDPSKDDVAVAGYQINRTDGVTAKAGSNSYQDNDLEPSEMYCYTVTAYDSSGNYSSPSGMVCATTMPTQDTPSVPTHFSVVPLSSSQLQLSWDASSDSAGIAGYIIYRNGIPVIDVPDGLTTVDTGLKASTRYCYTVSAYDRQGNVSAQTDPVCATTRGAGLWNAEVACAGSWYQVFFNLDLDTSTDSVVQADGTGNDYDGMPLAFVLTGTYIQGSGILNGSITWSFTGSPCIRVDDFSAALGAGDSGDVVMNQIQACGCTAMIRFISSGSGSSPAQSVSAAKSVATAPGTCTEGLFHSQECGKQ